MTPFDENVNEIIKAKAEGCIRIKPLGEGKGDKELEWENDLYAHKTMREYDAEKKEIVFDDANTKRSKTYTGQELVATPEFD